MEELSTLLRWIQSNQFMTGILVSGLLGAAALYLKAGLGFLRGKVLSRCVFSVVIESQDHAFEWVTAWFTSRSRKLRTVRIRTRRVSPDESPPLEELPGFRREYVPQPGAYVMWAAGRPVLLRLYRERERDRSYSIVRETYELTYPGTDSTLFENILQEGCRLAEKDNDLLDVYIVGEGGWHHLESRKPRSLESVILPGVLKQELAGDLETFLYGRDWYQSMGIPYRRGYLLHGPPGTGKSSIVSALAGHFRRSIYIVNLSQTSDAALRQLLCDVEMNSFVLMEDVDSFFRAPEPVSNAPPQRSLGGLLNLLDGVEAREGRILFMSANNVSILPPALIRPGRIDRTLYVGYADAGQIRAMLNRFFGARIDLETTDEFLARLTGRNVTMAALQEFLLARRDEPEALLSGLDALIRPQDGDFSLPAPEEAARVY